MAEPNDTAPPPKPCPVCGRPAQAAFRPFCSPRCRHVDLGRWLSGAYVIPGAERPPEAEGKEWTEDKA
jgi:endogenous inhibitor of DNA gyrase (YacG/DUF329 family)